MSSSGSIPAQALTVEALEQWAQAGAHWRVLHCSERLAVVELRQCTGELVARLRSDEPELIAYLDGIDSDVDVTTGGA